MIQHGNKVKDQYGNIGHVIEVRENSVLTTIDRNGWIHITKLVKI